MISISEFFAKYGEIKQPDGSTRKLTTQEIESIKKFEELFNRIGDKKPVLMRGRTGRMYLLLTEPKTNK